MKVIIIGAGISGLAVAYRLSHIAPDVETTVLEQRNRPGGTIWTERSEGFQFEIGANGFLDSKPSTLALCRDLGLGDRLIAASPAAASNRYLFWNGRLRLLPANFRAFLATELLSWRGKLRFLSERFRRRGCSALDESVAAFARRRAGAEAAGVFADALVTGIHAGDPALLSVRATFPRLVGLEEQYGSVLKGLAATARQRRTEAATRGQPRPAPGNMWSFAEGLRLLMERLSSKLPRPPVLGAGVRRLERAAADAPALRWTVRGEGQDCWHADAVVLTCPAHQQAAILHDLDPGLAEQIGGIAYNRVAVLALGYRRAEVPFDLNGFGYIAPQQTRRDVLGVQWCSSIFPGRAPEGAVLLRAMCGGWHRPEVVGWDDTRLLDAVRGELKLAMGIGAAPVFHRIVRWDRAIPQYHLGHLERVAQIMERVARHPGLFVGGNAYQGVAMNDCTQNALQLAAEVKRHLITSPAPPS